MRQLAPAVGSPDDQARILTEHEHYRSNSSQLLRAAAAADDAELARRVDAAATLEESIAATRRSLDSANAELEIRPDADQPGTPGADPGRGPRSPRLSPEHHVAAAPARDIER